ncbi:MAG: T9SS type A sorting domain-containing protein, partial [Bacteroidia bacterium]|nr:T9SS type A sorting domain-containing protein [Bacteroidia bacterium]
YPNPTSAGVDFVFETKEEGIYELEVLDLSGRKVTRFEKNVTAGIHNFDVDLSSFPSGLYFFKLKHGEKEELAKILKR